MQWTKEQIGNEFRDLHRLYEPHMLRLEIRRLLMERSTQAFDHDATGAKVPEAFEKSAGVFQTLIGDTNDVVQNYASRIADNEPQTSVIPVALNDRAVASRIEANAATEERLLMAQWSAAGGRAGQRMTAWSQSWGRVGWYLTLPREAAWGLPDRTYFDDLSDDEIDRLKASGEAVPHPTRKAAEPADSWMERRRKTAQERAVDGESLFYLRTFGPDQVIARFDDAGVAGKVVKHAFAIEELSERDFRPGSPLAKSAAKIAGKDIDKYGLQVKDGKVVGGIDTGGEPGSQSGATIYLSRFVTRDEVYYYATSTIGANDGEIVWHAEHGGGFCPLVPVPGMYTDSGYPGGEFSSRMESVFALIPLINQVETTLSNVASWNGLGRFVIEDPAGQLFDDEGNPIAVKVEDMIGGHPEQVTVVKGAVKQLKIDADIVFSLLGFYTERLDASKPAAVTEGIAGASAAAWQVRQLLESSSELIEQEVSNHAEAVKQIQRLWIRWMRMLDEPIYVVAAPGRRGNARSIRGLIEFDPKDLTESIQISQSTMSAQQRVVLRQSGVELLQAGRIDELEYYENYDLAPDPEESIVRAWAQKATDIVMVGNVAEIDPNSMLARIVARVEGRVEQEMLDEVPAFALGTARQMALSTAEQAAQGNVMESAQTRQPGLGMATVQSGSPDDQAPGPVL